MESLTIRIKQAYDNFDNTPIETIIELLDMIKSQFRSELTRNYLSRKIEELSKTNKKEQITLAKKLKPYLDWHLVGNP